MIMKKIENINPVIILSEFNEDIVENLYLGVKKSFKDSGIQNISEKKNICTWSIRVAIYSA